VLVHVPHIIPTPLSAPSAFFSFLSSISCASLHLPSRLPLRRIVHLHRLLSKRVISSYYHLPHAVCDNLRIFNCNSINCPSTHPVISWDRNAPLPSAAHQLSITATRIYFLLHTSSALPHYSPSSRAPPLWPPFTFNLHR
jgi:hypothetical protein